MNSLSWFLYLAEVVGRVQGFALFLSSISAFASLFYLFAYGCFKAGEEDAEAIVKTIWFVPWVFVVSVFFSLFTPDKQTVYLIAGSEAGETVVTSQEGREILNDVKAIIKQQLENMKAE